MDEECVCKTNDKLVVVKDDCRRKKATFLNPDRSAFVKFDVDGCLCKNVRAADKAVMKEGTGLVIVEFKGRDVETAARQIAATLDYFRQTDLPHGNRFAGLIVPTGVPGAAQSSVRKAQEAFRKKLGCSLHVKVGDNTYSLAKLV